MHALWSRTVRSQCKCRCVSCLSTTSNAVASRGSTATSRRRLRLGNSVTALYSSIFAAAALADARAKDNRRREWEEKIAAIKEEVSELIDEEKRILKSLSPREPSRSGIFSRSSPSQTRAFTTTGAGSSQTAYEKYAVSSRDPPSTEQAELGLRNDNSFEEELEDSLFEYAEKGDEGLAQSVAREWPAWATGDILRIKAIQKLAVKQLAIRFLLWPTVAHNYSGIPKHYDADFSLPELKSEDLLKELNFIGQRISTLKNNEDAPYDDLARDITFRQHHRLRMQRYELDDELQNDVNRYLNRCMSLPELLARLAHNLMKGDDPDRPRAFQLMILAFTKTRQNDLVDLTLRSLLPNRFEFTHPLIVTILTFFRKSKNLKDFDLFLHMLRGEGYPLNLKSTILFVKKVINGMEITVPPQASANPVLYNTLITAALCFGQADRAQAWLAAWRATGFTDDYSTLCAFLRFYSIKKDWENGFYTIMRALAFITSTSEHNEKYVGRLIVHIIHFCESCEMEGVADAVAEAAVQSGFDWEIAYREADALTDFARSFKRWEKNQIASEPVKPAARLQSTGRKCFAFSAALADALDANPDTPKDGDLPTGLTGTLSTSAIPSSDLEYTLNNKGEDGFETFSKADQTESSLSNSHDNNEIASLREEVARLKSLVTNFTSNISSNVESKVPLSSDQSLSNNAKSHDPPLTRRKLYPKREDAPSKSTEHSPLRKERLFHGAKRAGAALAPNRPYSEATGGLNESHEDSQRHVIVEVINSSAT